MRTYLDRGASGAYHALYDQASWRGPKGRRLAQLTAEPLCLFCALSGRTVEGTIADHWRPHGGDPEAFHDGRLISLCKPCHDGPKARLEAGEDQILFTDLDGYTTRLKVDLNGDPPSIQAC